MSKPEAFDIDKSVRNIANLPKPGGYGVLYRCPSCKEPLCIWLGDKEKFCHNCGESLFWGGVITHINSQQSNLLDQDKDNTFKEALLYLINKNIEFENNMDKTCYIME